MAMRKIGSRRIVVDEVAYRWVIRRPPTYDQGLCWDPMTVTVQIEDGSGAALTAKLDRPRPDHWLNLSGPPTSPLPPSEVAALIRLALAAGWRPAISGPRFVLALGTDLAPSPSP